MSHRNDPVKDYGMHHRFEYHQPTSESIKEDHQRIRLHCMSLSDTIQEIVPESRELSLALTKLEEAMFWANAGIARIKNYQSGVSPNYQ